MAVVVVPSAARIGACERGLGIVNSKRKKERKKERKKVL
jgi:hypothetical protein